MVCLASTGKEFDAENSLRVEYWWYPGEYHTFVANCLYFLKKINNSQFIEILFWGWWSMLQLSTKKKIHENRPPNVENTLFLAD